MAQPNPRVSRPATLAARDGRVVLSRPVHPGDAQPLTRFYAELGERTDRLYFVLAEYTVWIARDLIRHQVMGRELHLVLEAEDGSIVGHQSLQPFPGECPRVGVCVADGWQGQGIGRPWMELAIDLVEAQPQARGMWLSVLEENTVARELYGALGFEFVRRYVVRRDWSPHPANTGQFAMVDMLLTFPPRRDARDFLP